MYLWVICGVLALGVWVLYRRKKDCRVEYFDVDLENRADCLKQIERIENLQFWEVVVQLKRVQDMNYKYLETENEFLEFLQEIQNNRVIGVDIEEFRGSCYLGCICLIQISTNERVYLIDTLKLRKFIPRLGKLFADPMVVKIFHGCHNDTQWLQRDFGIMTVNVFDTHIAAKLLGLKKLGLNYLWKKFCGYSMTNEYKKKMQTSKWDQRPLTQEQLHYSATDAYFLPFLMSKLLESLTPQKILLMRKESNSYCKKPFSCEITPESSLKSIKKYAIQAIDSHTFHCYSQILKMRELYSRTQNIHPNLALKPEIILKIASEKPNTPKTLQNFDPNNKFLNKHIQQIISLQLECSSVKYEIFTEHPGKPSERKQKKQERFNKFIEKYTINKKVYENCQIQAPDGEILCFADTKKANWYLERSLAITVQESPLIIRLTFEPNGRGFSDVEADQAFYSKEKKNECVSCGGTKSYLKYHVVPLLYRQYFPDNYKSHRSHDVVLLCVKCHETANKHSDVLKKQISKDYGIPINSFSLLHKQKEELFLIRKTALSLIKNGDKLPSDRRDLMQGQILRFLEENQQYAERFNGLSIEESVRVLSVEKNCKELLGVYGEVNWRKELGNNHGKMVVDKITDLKAFIRRWRVNFIETLRPRNLPDSWNVDHLLNSPKFK